eukprot:XP_017948174.1 PREDICTED: up-regulator of cell proliferation-like [Xenopus tropicalis]
MSSYRTSKLTLNNVLQIGPENIQRTECQTIKDFPWYFLWKLMALSPAARALHVPCEGVVSEERNLDEAVEASDNRPCSVHALDVLCVLLHCSDPCLQQEILSKMCLCQFAFPLLLPAGDGPGCTYMLWAMRGIVKRWRPQSSKGIKAFKEDNLVHIKMPMFSFMRLGECSLSKSRILNQLLSPPHQSQEFFLHREMETGNMLRKISDGLVEISWYFPGGSEKMDVFKEPVAVANVRGDLQSALVQFDFLTRVSSAVFIFTENIGESEYKRLSKIENTETSYFIIILVPSSGALSEETERNIQLLQKMKGINTFKKKDSVTDRNFVKILIHIIEYHIQNASNPKNIEEMSEEAKKLGIHVDEESEDIKEAKKLAQEITDNIKNVTQYKKETMRLQGNVWKKISQIEKEMCRMREQGKNNAETYRAKLIKRCSRLRKRQNELTFPSDMQKFTEGITGHKLLFLKMMAFYIDAITRDHLHSLNTEYEESFCHSPGDVDRLKEIDLRILNSSLGAEHFLRELGQFYEAKYSTAQGTKIKGRFRKYPGIVAELFLDGFPLELIDGDASNIPIHWITDILSELDSRTGGRYRMRVITVLGVQSTGKSTLLNTMFGLKFPVGGGRCTRGAFMTLLHVKDKLQYELGCEFILVVDTEGLRSPEMASLEGSYEHDNEMATLVVGLSDITIINMAMENTAEMKDILQLVIHAFLRMKQIGKKHNCQFVHQNVSDVSAHEKNLRDRQKLLQQLDKMTEVAARMEKKSQITTFSDIIDYNLEEHTWYIPGLWYGVPPMASVNAGYSDGVNELKKYLISYMKKMNVKPQTIPEFTEWIKSLWNAVKHEKFIFSFRNSLVSEAYNQLCMHYTGWEWNFQKATYKSFKKIEIFIKNLPADEIDRKTWGEIKEHLSRTLRNKERIVSESLEKYFTSGCDNVHLLEPFRSDFFQSVKYLRETQEMSLTLKSEELFLRQKEKCKIQKVLDRFIQIMEDRVAAIIEVSRNSASEIDDHQLKREFIRMWEKTLQEVPMPKNDPGYSLRNRYFSIFKSIYKEKDESQKRARYFCELCLEPAILQYIWEYTGFFILNDILHREDALEFRSRTVFQFKVLTNLLERMSFRRYRKYINDYESFAKSWILDFINHQYKGENCGRNWQILKSIIRKVSWALETVSKEETGTVLDSLEHFCSLLSRELAIEKKYLQLVMFQNKTSSSEFLEQVRFFLNDMEEKIIVKMREFDIGSILSQVTLKPQDELFKKVIGCGKQCPFCKVPCEAGAADHKEHFASLHRPKGLAKCNQKGNMEVLDYSTCSTDITSNGRFTSEETGFKPHPYKDYRTCYPDWIIYPEMNTDSSDYWKFVFKEFNQQFAGEYGKKTADIPEDWQSITREKALHSLKESFRLKEG